MIYGLLRIKDALAIHHKVIMIYGLLRIKDALAILQTFGIRIFDTTSSCLFVV